MPPNLEGAIDTPYKGWQHRLHSSSSSQAYEVGTNTSPILQIKIQRPPDIKCKLKKWRKGAVVDFGDLAEPNPVMFVPLVSLDSQAPWRAEGPAAE